AWVLAVWGQEAVDLSPEFAEDCQAGSCTEHEDAALLQKPGGGKPSHTKDKKHPVKKTPDPSYKITIPSKKPGNSKDEKSPGKTNPGKKLGHTKDKKDKKSPGKKPDVDITNPGKKLGHTKDKKDKKSPGKKLGHTKDKKYPGKKPGKKPGHGKSKKGPGKKPAYHKTMAKARMSMPAQEEDQTEAPQAPEESEVPDYYDPSFEVPAEGQEQPESEMPESV
ncbi:unnamed protein product, partial [Symbiodinium sp. CCMP2456]